MDALRAEVARTWAGLLGGEAEAWVKVAVAVAVLAVTVAALVWQAGGSARETRLRVGELDQFAVGTMKAVKVQRPGAETKDSVLVVRTKDGVLSAFPPMCTCVRGRGLARGWKGWRGAWGRGWTGAGAEGRAGRARGWRRRI
jgi:hypothetical protein